MTKEKLLQLKELAEKSKRLDETIKLLEFKINTPMLSTFQDESLIEILYTAKGEDYHERWLEQQRNRNK